MVSDCTIRRNRLADQRGSALVITMLLLVILTAIGIYAFSISTTEMSISLNSRVGAVTRYVAEAGAFYGIDQVPNTYPSGTTINNITVGTNMTAGYTVTSDISGPLSIQPGYGVNYRFADFSVLSSVSTPPTGYTTGARVDASVSYGPIPSGTGY
jgi:Tfp pilus assembly protein PilX